MMRPLVRPLACAAIAVVVASGAISAYGQGVTIEHLGSGSALTGVELIPMYQGADPAVTTTPTAIATYVNQHLSLTINSGHTEITGLSLSGYPTGDGVFLYGDTGGLLQPGILYFDSPNNRLVVNYTTTALAALQSLPGAGNAVLLYGQNPGLSIYAIGSAGNGIPVLAFGAALNNSSGWTLNALDIAHPIGQIFFDGYNGSSTVEGAVVQVVTTQAWTGTANGVQWQWCAVANGATFGSSCFIMALDATNGLVLAGVPVQASEGIFSAGVALNGSPPSVSAGRIGYGGSISASSNCGSLAGATGCVNINVGGTAHYVPYY